MHKIHILDSGDTYFITRDGPGYTDGILLYSMIDVMFEEIQTVTFLL